MRHQKRPTLALYPQSIRQGDLLSVQGANWDDCPVRISVDGKMIRPWRVAQGLPVGSRVRPDASGAFAVDLLSSDLNPGKHKLTATSEYKTRPQRVDQEFSTLKRAAVDPKIRDEDIEKCFLRSQDFFMRRFRHVGFVPPGTRRTQIDQVRRLRAVRDRLSKGLLFDTVGETLEPRMPVPGACNWTPAGSGPVAVGSTTAFAGRTLSIAIDPSTPTSMYIGTAQGGIWKSVDGGMTWSPKSDYANSLAIGALAIDPSNPQRIFAGTGEYNNVGVGTYYGNGILYSANGGDTWAELATTTFERDEISRILFDPTDATSQRMFLSSSIGVYESTDGGVNWTQLRAGSASDLTLLVAAGPPAAVTLVAAFYGSGIWTSTRTGGSWSSWTQLASAAFPAVFQRIALGQCRGNPNNIYAAFSNGGSLAGIARTIDGGTNWTSVAGPGPGGQTWYNLHITVHPSDANTVYFGEVPLWKTTAGGPPWTSLPIPHSDQHAFAFDPTNPLIVWAANDGGVYRSADGGATWVHRNRDLATMQYISVAVHPTAETVMLGGTQDNGTHRCTGNPAWQFSDGGDGGFTAIDPAVPTRMYHQYVYTTLYRSDMAGAPGSWVLKTGAITGSAEFYSPFALDPSNPSVCYFGGNQLWRSPNNADTWAAITNALIGNITAIAVHPADATTIFVGTTAGRVYKVQRTGATWNLADVTTTNLTGANLPANVSISDIAVDAAGNVWVAVAAVLWSESSGEFTNAHVYRRAAGGSVWEVRSTGLAAANPINAIVIDPMDANRLFCGGDVGVFRTDNAGVTWAAWDEGLPNVAVFDLAIQPSRRLLRAATHGRSVWERPIDTAVCPMVDLYVRDYILDSGRVQPSLAYQPNPIDPVTLVSWWESVDIKVDAQQGSPPAFQTATPIDDYVRFEGMLQDRSPQRNRTNRFYVQVHNRGVSSATNVQVRPFFADASAGLPALPADFWSSGKPFVGTPSSTAWTPLGPTKTIPVLEPAEPGVLEWDFLVPSGAATHSCLLAVATCTEDPISAAGIFDVGVVVTTRKHVALKNLHVVDPPPGMPLPPEQACILQLHNPDREAGTFDILLNWGSLPRGTRLFAVFERAADRKPMVGALPDDLKRAGVSIVRPRRQMFLATLARACGESTTFDLTRVYQIDRSREGRTVIPGIRIPGGAAIALAINFVTPRGTKQDAAQFSVAQQSGGHVIGGSTYVLRLAPAAGEKRPGRQPRRGRR